MDPGDFFDCKKNPRRKISVRCHQCICISSGKQSTTFSQVSSMYMYKLRKTVNNKVFFGMNYSKSRLALFDHQIMKIPVAVKVLHTMMPSVQHHQCLWINSMKLIHDKVFLIEIILSPATAFWIIQSWKIHYVVKTLHA